MKYLVLYDFDGTITSKDTYIPFIRFVKGNLNFYSGLFRLVHEIIFFKFGIIPNWRLKEKFLYQFFHGMSIEILNDFGKKFSKQIIPGMVRSDALESIRIHQKAGARIVIVTASFDTWVKPWADLMNLELIATRLEEEEGRVSGYIKGKNCYGPEKVTRIKSYLNISEYPRIYCYGDSEGDREMLEIGTDSFYRSFDLSGNN